ncbi:MAG: hypothetical protein M1338_05230 [Patescibacteria group bacterium]|nr:hypothetical protein [Patescibacteria group bacterium]
MNNKYLMIAIIALLVIIVGYLGYNEYKKIPKKNPAQYYLSFTGDYSYQIPDGFVVDDITVPNAQLVSKKDEKIQVNNISEIYAKGVVAVQAFDAQLPDETSFKSYINNYKDILAKSLQAEATVDFAKTNGFWTATIRVNSGGKLIRTQYIYNADKPVTVVALDENDTYKTIVESLNSAEKQAKDFAQIQSNIEADIFMIKNKMFDDVYRLSAKTLTDKVSQGDFKKSFDKVSIALQANTSVFGGISNSKNNEFTTTLLFTKPSDKTGDNPQNALGTIVLKKEGSDWKLSGITLPSDEAFNSTLQQ